jgi:adenylyltransferase/sulfurtransferase
MRYAPMGEEGQRRLLASKALICGCGALGSVLANTLARAGVGRLTIVDRDFLETNNLQRQNLYDEDDVAAGLPKAIAAKAKLERINSDIAIEAVVADVNHLNILALAEGADVLLDGTDNFETRYLLNDVSQKLGIPWVFGGCLGADGQTMTIVPGETPCLRCLHPEPPGAGASPTCDTAGILAPIINVVGSWQASEALKILSGRREAVSRSLTVFEMWDNRVRQIKLDALAGEGCPACRKEEFPWLEGKRGGQTAILCGRNAVQLSFPGHAELSLANLAEKLSGVGRVSRNAFLLRLEVDDYQLTVFPDGRAIIGGTEDVALAKSVYARYVGA